MADDGKQLAVVLDIPVVEVTLLEDRARVVRKAAIELSTGQTRARIEGVSPVLSDKTLTGAIAGGDGARVVDAQVFRRLVMRQDDVDREPASELATLQAELEQREAELQSLEDETALLGRHAAGLDRIAQLTFAELAEDVSWARDIGPEWAGRIDDLHNAERDLRERLVTLAAGMEECQRILQRLRNRLDRLHDPPEREAATIEAVIAVERAGSYTLVIDYVVPGACWRPYHTAQLIEGDEPDRDGQTGARVVFTTDACVWQNSGEDWCDVNLVFSTERASLGTNPPVLHSDILAVQKKSDQVVVEAREQEIQTTGLGGGERPSGQLPDLPGIDDGGVVRAFRASTSTTVPADGRPYRIQLQSFEVDARVQLVAMPELAQCVFAKSIQENRGSGPILAGPVDLIRQSGFVGRTSVLFVAAGERFEIAWGPEPDLRVKRTTEVSEDKSRLLSSWIVRTHKIYVMLSNLGDRNHSIEITERVPVSEIDKVKIQIDTDKTTGHRESDKNGMVTWQLEMRAHDHERIQLHYQLKKHEDVRGI
ncbi:MAG: mucoidy inhibitor MuiA family protein [Proteobacteria bacterium]|nr:mucoidy inhibitor MuiA family protein [Pseudomonadota bacterium]